MYQPYIDHLREMPARPDGTRVTIDREQCPTLQDLFASLLDSKYEEAQQLALCMEPYTTGAFDTFAHKTNVDVTNRVVVYDIKNIGDNLRELALKVCTYDIWNRLMANKREGKWTWFYIDEFHLLLANPSTANFLKTVWKRARKWQGIPTGITQNMEEMLASPEARAIINNSNFVYMLDQSKIDRDILQDILKLTDADMEYVTNAPVGTGLIYTGKQTIPFQDNFPKDTKLFELYSTKAEDDDE
jgi:type IV secretory pathway VirB4 component